MEHLEAMSEHSKQVISHFKSIGHGNESLWRKCSEKSIEGAEQFLIPSGKEAAQEQDYCLLNRIVTYCCYHG